MSRNFGMSGRASLGGASADTSTYGAHSTRADAFEIGAWCFSIAVIALPAVIVGGIVLGYLLFC